MADEHGANGRVVDLRILPSHITRGDKTWQIYARKIRIDTARIVIDKFFVMNREQELRSTASPRAAARIRHPRAAH
ncbi:MAG: hypothetical protein ACLSHL_09320 [Alistipes communis]